MRFHKILRDCPHQKGGMSITMNNTNLLTDRIINKIKTEYKDDISLLLAVRGHVTDHDGHGELFDYYIPETDRGCELAQTFIIDGIGHDLYPRSWERMEKSAELEEMVLILANATILYARSGADAERFRALQQKLQTNLNDPLFVYRKALDSLDSAMDLYRTLLFEEKSYRARSQACCIHLYLSQAVACMNHTFTDSPIFSETQAYTGTPENRMYHCPGLDYVPESFFAYARLLPATSDPKELCRIMHALIRTTRNFVLAGKPETAETTRTVSYQGLADWYQELSLTWRRIRFFCQHNMVEEAYTDACYLQEELIVIAQEFQLEELNLLDSFHADSLAGLELRSRKLEQIIRRILTEHGIRINEYDSLNEFLNASAL